jgi:hypothetical protein
VKQSRERKHKERDERRRLSEKFVLSCASVAFPSLYSSQTPRILTANWKEGVSFQPKEEMSVCVGGLARSRGERTRPVIGRGGRRGEMGVRWSVVVVKVTVACW